MPALNQQVEWGLHIRPTRAEIDMSRLVANARFLSARTRTPLLAVVKADAYGHGAASVALALQKEAEQGWQGLRGFAVSLVEEGVELREAGVSLPVLVMGPSLMGAHALLLEYQLTPMISDARHLEPLQLLAESTEKCLGIHLMVDTGMGRLGIAAEALGDALNAAQALSNLKVEAIASHLACADVDDTDDESSMTRRQIALFSQIIRDFGPLCPRGVEFHLANSAALLRFPEAHCDLVRPGLALYGNGNWAVENQELRQVFRLVSEITQIRHISKGGSVSYGARWVASRETKVAIVPVGYADGLPRSYNADGRARVLVLGRRCSILGTISMDMIVVDVTEFSEAKLGDEVVVFGEQGGEGIGVSEVANRCEISEYEVTCGISKRVPRARAQHVDE